MYELEKKAFTERLKIIRISRKLSQVEVSTILGLSRGGYRSYEIGRTVMPINVALKFAKELDVSLELLFFGKENEIDNKLIDIKNNTCVETKLENGFLIMTTRVPLSKFLSR